MKLNVLYEDNHLIAVLKPAGVLAQGDDAGNRSLMDDVKDYLKEKYKKTGNVFLGLIHRLDRPVRGIMLFAKTSKGASRLSEQFRLHTIEKIYHAWVEGIPKEHNQTLRHYLVKDDIKNKAFVYEHEVPHSDYAELDYELVKTEQNCALLKVKLHTGRFHQIRAQLSFIGHPIVGDKKYGAKEAMSDQAIKLVATQISFNLAVGEERKTLTIDIPILK